MYPECIPGIHTKQIQIHIHYKQKLKYVYEFPMYFGCLPGLSANINTNTNAKYILDISIYVPGLQIQIKYKSKCILYLVCRASGTEDLELVARLVDVLQAHL